MSRNLEPADSSLTRRKQRDHEPPITDPSDPRNLSHRGYWNPEGEWIETDTFDAYWNAPLGSVTYWVRGMVAQRRGRGLSPRQAALAVEAAPELRGAFPNREAWLKLDDQLAIAPEAIRIPPLERWPMMPTSTSAEEAVKRATLGERDRATAVRLGCMCLDKKGKPYWPDDSPPVSPERLAAWRNSLGKGSESIFASMVDPPSLEIASPGEHNDPAESTGF